jgi:hypothetical protein
MPEQELDLFQFATIHMAEFRARSAEIMRGKMVQLHPFGTPPNHVPNHIL